MSLERCATSVQNLFTAVQQLQQQAKALALEPLAGREWYELLRQKLVPQLVDDVYLIAAVVGGTNIGKSVIFNHLAGFAASSTSPLASGTKHPVCLLPAGFTDKHDLDRIFTGFTLKDWSHGDAALQDSQNDLLYWRTCKEIPANLLVLDTPDIDSDAQVNWRRADAIRRAADVLIAVLTQQKYNDAAVKQFFRHAAEEDKAVIVIFNQCLLPEDEQYWPIWLKTFCNETGTKPMWVYLAPNDRVAAEASRLPFYERSWPHEAGETAPADAENASCDLVEVLSQLHFDDIKLQALRGSINLLLNKKRGVPAYLKQIREQSDTFRTAAERLSAESVTKVANWPPLPNAMLIAEIREWWKTQRSGWAKSIHDVYDTIGWGVMLPFRYARQQLTGEQKSSWDVFRKAEWEAVLVAVSDIYEKLTWMSESAASLLRPHFQEVIQGKSRADLLAKLKAEHDRVDLEQQLREIVAAEMQRFQMNSPESYKFYLNLNQISAAARPLTSVVFFTLGFGPAGDVVAPIVTDLATQTAVHVVADVTGGATAAVAGETVVSSAAGQGAGYLQIKFQSLQTAFVKRRVDWMVKLLQQHLLGDLPMIMQTAANIPQLETYQLVVQFIRQLEVEITQMNSETEPNLQRREQQ